MKVLIIGGTGVTGIPLVKQLLAQGCELTVLHRGNHAANVPAGVTQIIADPHAKDGLTQALAGQKFDAVIATYGRLRYVVQQLIGVTERVISVGGAAPVYKGFGQMTAPNPWETTEPTPLFLPEDHALASAETDDVFSQMVRATEQSVMAIHQQGALNITHFRYPLVYGPQNLCPAEWGLIKRALDQRRPLILPAGGRTIVSRGYSENVAHALVLALNNPSASAGKIYNVCDAEQLPNYLWVEKVGKLLGHEFDCIDIPFELLPEGFRASPPQLLYRHHTTLDIGNLQRDLGYSDLVSVDEALARTVAYYQANPLAADHPAALNLGDPFAYDYEDQLIAQWRGISTQTRAAFAAVPAPAVIWQHPYQKK